MTDPSALFTGTFCLVPLLFFLVTIWLWRWVGMWFSGMRELIREVRGLRQDIQMLRGYAQPGIVGAPPPAAYTPTTPALPPAQHSAPPATTYTPTTPVYDPRQMSATPPPGWSGPWDPSQWSGGQK